MVAGGTGFIGRQIAARLQAAGHRVVVLGRGRGGAVLPDGVELRRCDLARAIDPSLLSGIEVLINCVGIKRESAGELSWERAHVELPCELAEAAAAAGISRMVHLSVAGCEGATAESGP